MPELFGVVVEFGVWGEHWRVGLSEEDWGGLLRGSMGKAVYEFEGLGLADGHLPEHVRQ